MRDTGAGNRPEASREMAPIRQMRNPEAWIGKRAEHLNYDRFLADYDKCDDCGHFHKVEDMHALLYPMTQADMKLQRAVGVEEAQTFCPDCLGWIEDGADGIDPGWRRRHFLA